MPVRSEMDIATAKREAAAGRKEETAAAKAESEAAERERAAGAEKKEAHARKLAARKKAVAAEAIINNTSTVAAAPAPSMPPRNRRGDEELVQLPDMNKNSLDAMRQKRKAVNGRFSVGERVQAKYGMSQGKPSCGWFSGTVDDVRDAGEWYVYDLSYDDGDKERCVLGKYVRGVEQDEAPSRKKSKKAAEPSAHTSAPAPAPAPTASSAAPNAPAPKAPAPKAPAPKAPAPAPAPAAPPVPAPAPTPKAVTPKPIAPKAPVPPPAKPLPPPPPSAPKAATCQDFLYMEPWHVSADHCIAHGCRLQHVKLQDFLPKAQSSDREKMRRAVRNGEMIGTASVPKPGERGTGSQRDKWWWHQGDPALARARDLLLR